VTEIDNGKSAKRRPAVKSRASSKQHALIPAAQPNEGASAGPQVGLSPLPALSSCQGKTIEMAQPSILQE